MPTFKYLFDSSDRCAKPLISPYETFPLSNITVAWVVPMSWLYFNVCTHVDRVDGKIIIFVFVERQLWGESDSEIMAFKVSYTIYWIKKYWYIHISLAYMKCCLMYTSCLCFSYHWQVQQFIEYLLNLISWLQFIAPPCVSLWLV